MRRGPKPKSTNTKILEGRRAHRRLNLDAPELPPADSFHADPAQLEGDPVALEEWRHIAPMLANAGAVTEGDRSVMIALCQQWSRYIEATQQVRKVGMIVKSPNGYPVQNPYLPIANKTIKHCMALWGELGLTPSARTRVIADPAPLVGNPFMEFEDDADPPRAAH